MLLMMPRRLRNIKIIDRLAGMFVRNSVINVDDFNLSLYDPESIVMASGWYEPWMKSFDMEEGIVVDIGANIGRHTLRFAKQLTGKGLVVAVEPNPDVFKVLKSNLHFNGLNNVVLINKALSNSKGSVRFYRSKTSGTFSMKHNFGLGEVEIDADTLDNILAELDLPKINAMKIDAEGAELEVLEGAKKTIECSKPSIVIECSRENLSRLTDFMRQRNYNVEEIEDPEHFVNYSNYFCQPNRP